MATQEWTIFTLIGTALAEIEARLKQWSSTRKSDDNSAWSTTDWPPRTRSAASRLMLALEQHNTVPPVIYFSRHLDLWSSPGELFRFIPHAPPPVCSDVGEIWAYRLPDRGKLARPLETGPLQTPVPRNPLARQCD